MHPIIRGAAIIVFIMVSQPAQSSESGLAGPKAGQSRPSSRDIDLAFYGNEQGGRTAPLEVSAGRALFKVFIDGRETWALLDNRSERSIIDAGLARSLNLDIAPASGTFRSPLGLVGKRRVSNVPVVVPFQLEMHAPALAAVDLKPLSVLHGREIGFVLGQDYLAGFALHLDLGKLLFRIAPSGSARPPEGLQAVSVAPETHLVEAEVLGSKAKVLLNFGLEVPLRVSPSQWNRIRASASSADSIALRGRPMATLAIGGMKAANVPVDVLEPDEGGSDISIGLALFSRANLLLDLGQGKLWLLPSAGSTAMVQ